MLRLLWTHIDEVAAVVLFCIGFTTLLLNRNMIKKIIGFSMMDTAIFLFLADLHRRDQRSGAVCQPPAGQPGADGHCRLRKRDGDYAGAYAAHVPTLPHARH